MRTVEVFGLRSMKSVKIGVEPSTSSFWSPRREPVWTHDYSWKIMVASKGSTPSRQIGGTAIRVCLSLGVP